jgi:hypothetical protein
VLSSALTVVSAAMLDGEQAPSMCTQNTVLYDVLPPDNEVSTLMCFQM